MDEIIYAYTRRQAIADGVQIDITEEARKAGFNVALYMTAGAFAATVEAGGEWKPSQTGGEILELPAGQDTAGRLWDVFQLLRNAITQHGSKSLVCFGVLVDEHGNGKRRYVELHASIGPKDIDDPAPAITIMLPGED